MSELQELEVLILELIGKHPTINNTYTLTRFFAKSSVLPDKLYKTLKDLVSQEYIFIRETKNTINFYQLLPKGENIFKTFDIFEFLETFTIKIDKTGFISKIVFLLENKDHVVEIIDSYKLSDDRLIAFINSDDGKLDDSTILQDYQRKKWMIKGYLHVHGSIKNYETIKQQETENTFQYVIEGIGHTEKPVKGERLKVFKNTS